MPAGSDQPARGTSALRLTVPAASVSRLTIPAARACGTLCVGCRTLFPEIFFKFGPKLFHVLLFDRAGGDVNKA